MGQQQFEVDTVEGQQALLHVRDANGIDWFCGAVLSPLRSATSDEERVIAPDEGLTVVSLKVVIP
jgi:hypothetical protein